ncbi:hypothetical protein STENM223S_00363 [Streptomyces tendae]
MATRVDGALVAPFGRHLAYGNDPRTEMTVSWQVPVAVKKPFSSASAPTRGPLAQDRRRTAPAAHPGRRRERRPHPVLPARQAHRSTSKLGRTWATPGRPGRAPPGRHPRRLHQVGGGPGGYYTKADYTEIVRYAASRHLEVIPEIDMPGHTNAALASYAELNCDGVAPPLYTGTKVGFSSLCVGKDLTYDFVDDVLGELAALTPGRYLHIGGDEAHSTPHADYVTFMQRVQPIVAKYGKTVVGWHQLAGAGPAEGALVQYWGLDRTGAAEKAQVAEAARNGTGLILSPADRAYLDMKYTKDTPLGLSWAGYVEVQRSYDWDPAAYLPGAPAEAVRGVEAPLWTETLSDPDQLEFMAFPRLPGVAELGWSPASTHDWETYKVRVAAQAPRWEAAGVNYYSSPQVPWA